MVSPALPEFTTFSWDSPGRFICNTIDEALRSAGQVVGGQQRTFDVIVVGGGSFGSIVAEALFQIDHTRSRRILVLEAGPYVLAEHAQNTPLEGGTPGFRVPWVNDPALTQDLQYPGLLYAIGGRSLLWGGWCPEPLHDAKNDELTGWPVDAVSDLTGGLLLEAGHALGTTATNDFVYGPLHEALRARLLQILAFPTAPPGVILDDLPPSPVVQAWQAETGTPPANAQLLEWLNLQGVAPPPSQPDLLRMLKLEAPLAVQAKAEPGFFPFNKFSTVPLLTEASRTASAEADGVDDQGNARKRVMVVDGCHVQELITETQADGWVRVVGVRAVDRDGLSHDIPLAPPGADGTQAVVVIALGTIESTRLALTTFQASLAFRAAQRMGENFLAHLRSNLTIRIPTASLPALGPAVTRWRAIVGSRVVEVSALFVKGKANIGGVDRYFHMQVTASGATPQGNNSEAMLFRKIPDLDFIDALLQADETSVVVTIRGIGEMATTNLDSHVGLAQTPGDVDFGRPKAYANLADARAASGGNPKTQSDRDLWEAMDEFAEQLAIQIANGQSFDVLAGTAWGVTPPDRVLHMPATTTSADLKAMRKANNGELERVFRDPLGTTHHEAGTLRMSDTPAGGVTNSFGRIHDTTNCYVVGPALFPRTGSVNPMLTGVALARRTAKMLTASVLRAPAPWTPDAGFRTLFDGTAVTYNRWTRVSPNTSCGFALINGEIVTYGTSDFGLLYYAVEPFADSTLSLEFRVFDPQNQNSGVFVRFRDPLGDPPAAILDRILRQANDFPAGPTDAQLYARNRAWSAVYSGFEIQIDDNARGDPRKSFYGIPEPDGLNKNRTGAIYKIPAGDAVPWAGITDAKLQNFTRAPNLVMQRWYRMEVDVRGNNYTVKITDPVVGNATTTTTFTNADGVRGVAVENGQPVSYIGLQSYPGSPVAFRRIQVKP